MVSQKENKKFESLKRAITSSLLLSGKHPEIEKLITEYSFDIWPRIVVAEDSDRNFLEMTYVEDFDEFVDLIKTCEFDAARESKTDEEMASRGFQQWNYEDVSKEIYEKIQNDMYENLISGLLPIFRREVNLDRPFSMTIYGENVYYLVPYLLKGRDTISLRDRTAKADYVIPI